VNFYAACNDTAPLAKTPPAVGIRLLFIQGESRQEIGKTDANETLEFSATVNIPKDAKEGDAAIVAEITSRDVERSAPFKVISKK
jgi:hypothetical protein